MLDRADGVTRFVHFTVAPRLEIAPGTVESLARSVLEKAERACLITNSLTAERVLEPSVAAAAETG